MSVWNVVGIKLHHPIAQVYLIIEVFSLELIQIEVQLALQDCIRDNVEQVRRKHRAVKRTDYIKLYGCGIFRIERKFDTLFLVLFIETKQVLYNSIQNCGLTHTVYATENVHVGCQFPFNVSLAIP